MAPKAINSRSVLLRLVQVNIDLATFCVLARDLRGNHVCFYVEAQDNAAAWQEAEERRGIGGIQAVQPIDREYGARQ